MHFRVQRSLPFGSTLHLTGSTPALSSWSASAAPACAWTNGDIWTLSIDPISPQAPPYRFEFKFFARSPSGDADWEPGENHAVVVPAGAAPDSVISVHWATAGELVLPVSDSAAAAAANPAASPPPTPAGHAARSRVPNPLGLAVARVVGNGHTHRPSTADPTDSPTNPPATPNTAHPSVSASGNSRRNSSKASTDPPNAAGTTSSSSTTVSNGRPAAAAANGLSNGGPHHHLKNGTTPATQAALAPQQQQQQQKQQPDFFTLAFRLKYAPANGERIYIVGSIPELGAWNKMHSPRLAQVTRDYFEVRLRIPNDERHSDFEYKYFTRRDDGSRRWEGGENRVARPRVFDSAVIEDSPALVFDDRWEKIRLEFSILLPSVTDEVMHITGDLPEIGAWFKPGPTRMALGPMQMLETDVKGRKWVLKVWVDPATEPFSYRYIFISEKTKHELWEREPNRQAKFDVKEPVVNGVRVMKDVNFVSEMKFDKVPPNMFIGPYPQSEDDVDKMASAGVTGVFNVQTDEDFKHRAIQWDVLKRRYDKHGIKVVRFPIRDFDRDSLRERLRAATHALDDMIKAGLDVYVHCTAGMGRAPACSVAYLCWVKKMDLTDAVAHVKKYRTVAVPNVIVLEQALKTPY